MVILAERSLQTVLNNAFSLFRQNLSTFVPDVFAQETAEHQQEITNWWSNSENAIPVMIGYSLQPTQDAQVSITMEPSQEIAGQRFIGNTLSQITGGTEQGTTFQGMYAMHVFGVNQNWLLWTQALVQWALEMNREVLETEYALFNQLISMSGLRPVPDALKDSVFPYERTVFLSCQHVDTWSQIPVATITSATVNVVPTYTEI